MHPPGNTGAAFHFNLQARGSLRRSFIDNFSQQGVTASTALPRIRVQGISWSLKGDNGHTSPSVLTFPGSTADEESGTQSLRAYRHNPWVVGGAPCAVPTLCTHCVKSRLFPPMYPNFAPCVHSQGIDRPHAKTPSVPQYCVLLQPANSLLRREGGSYAALGWHGVHSASPLRSFAMLLELVVFSI